MWLVFTLKGLVDEPNKIRIEREIFEDVTEYCGSGSGARWRQLMFMTQRIAELYRPEGVNICHHVLMNTE